MYMYIWLLLYICSSMFHELGAHFVIMLCICMYICLYVCHVCMSASMHACRHQYACKYKSMHVCMYVSKHLFSTFVEPHRAITFDSYRSIDSVIRGIGGRAKDIVLCVVLERSNRRFARRLTTRSLQNTRI